MDLKVEVLQQEGTKLLVHYFGEVDEDGSKFSVDRKLKITLPSLANISIIKEAIKMSVRNDFIKTKYVGLKFDMEVNYNGNEPSIR